MSDSDEATGPATAAGSSITGHPKWLVALEAHRDLVGTISDRALARRAGVSASAARRYRTALGLAEVRDVPVKFDLGAHAPESILDRLPARRVALPAEESQAPSEPPERIIARHAHRLDTLPDWMLARDLAVSVDDIRAWRERALTTAGASPDSESPPTASHRRKSLQESPKTRNLEEILAPHAHLLGVLSDIAVAQRAGVRPSEVAEFRASRAVPSIPPQAPVEPERAPVATPVEEEELPPEPEAPEPVAAETAAEPSTSRTNDTMSQEKPKKSRAASRKPTRATGKKRGPESPIAKYAHLLGVLPDHEVAKRAGVTPAGVLKYRHRHGVKAAPRRPAGGVRAERAATAEAAGEAAAGVTGEQRRGRPPGRASKLDAFRDVIGVKSDREVAVLAGLTTNAVQMYRKKHGIPASGKRARAAAEAAPEAAPAVTAEAVAPTEMVAETPPGAPRRRGRPPGRRAEAAPAPAVAPVAVAQGGAWYGWRIKVASGGGELERIVVARDAASACSAGASVGEVVSVERIGEGIPT